MDNVKFTRWIGSMPSKPQGQIMIAFFDVLGGFPGADGLLETAKTESWTLQKMAAELKAAGQDVSTVESLLVNEIPAPPASEVVLSPREKRLAELREKYPINVTGSAAEPVPAPNSPTAKADDVTKEQGEKPVKASPLGFLKKIRLGKKKKTVAEAEKPTTGSKKGIKKTILIVAILLVVVAAVVAAVMISGGGNEYPDYSPAFDDNPSQDSSMPQEAMPVLTNPNPLDFVSSPWLKGLQGLIFAELIGIILAVMGDSKFRKQWGDSVVALSCALVVIFVAVPPGVPTYFAGILLAAMIGIVALVSFMGGRDFSPAAAFFLVIGIVGGLIFNKIALLQGVTKIVSAPVLPMVQLGVVFQLKNWAAMGFPLLIYFIIIIGVAVSFFEALRPSEDKTPRLGTMIAA
ncbi:MAG: hypothetical protein UW31_C0017G0016, partial [Candidatus Collierbacteria bacterium GW2011_GWA2_44_13]